jgi:hypothetical protein
LIQGNCNIMDVMTHIPLHLPCRTLPPPPTLLGMGFVYPEDNPDCVIHKVFLRVDTGALIEVEEVIVMSSLWALVIFHSYLEPVDGGDGGNAYPMHYLRA